MKILVTGAAGFIGSRFCEMADAAGHDVTAFMRPRQNLAHYPRGRVVYGHLPYDMPARAWDGAQALVHAAAATTGQGAAESDAVNLEGTRFLLEQAKKRGTVNRIIFLSSQSAHEDAVSTYGVTKHAGEKLVRDSGIPYFILRPGLVFGPGPHGLFHRMRSTVRKLPVLPLLGGGRALVQGIEVGDLCRAILTCLGLPANESAEFNLGDPEGMPLRDFLQAIAVAETGQRKTQVMIPLGPVKWVVKLAEGMGLKLPVSSANLQGMEKVQRMETGESLRRLGLSLTPFDDAMKGAVTDIAVSPRGNDPLNIMLIGAGKIGIVHSLNLIEREGARLCGIVDHSAKPFGLYKSMGFEVPFSCDLETAIRDWQPDGAIVATPAATHYALARQCLERGLPVLVEKPMSTTSEGAEGFIQLHAEFPGQVCHVGYMIAQYPHLQKVAEALSSGSLGAVKGFWAFGLQTHIMAAKPVRWEMIKAKSGGGVLINFAGHIFSVLMRLFGEPESCDAQMWPIYSTEVEDAAEVRMRYKTFSGRLFASWSLPGYVRPENRIVIELERGRIVITNFCAELQKDGKTAEVWTQRDYDIGFNAAPDYTGGGFSMEHRNFLRAIRSHKTGTTAPDRNGAVGIQEAAALEKLIFAVYAKANDTEPSWSQPANTEYDREMDSLIGMVRPRASA